MFTRGTGFLTHGHIEPRLILEGIKVGGFKGGRPIRRVQEVPSNRREPQAALQGGGGRIADAPGAKLGAEWSRKVP